MRGELRGTGLKREGIEINTKVPDLDKYKIICNERGRYRANRTWVEYYFKSSYGVTRYEVFPDKKREKKRYKEKIKLLKRGDLLRYKGHITTVYCTKDDLPPDTNAPEYEKCKGLKDGEYMVIHASGLNNVCWDNPKTKKRDCTPDFDRLVRIHKVRPNSNMTGGLDRPLGFGRIKLW